MYLGQVESASGPITVSDSEVNRLTRLRGKRSLDLILSIVGLSLMCIFALMLMLLNPILNPGPLFYRQQRMGKDGNPFTMWKFRTMALCAEGSIARPALSPLETERITPFAQLIRRFRIDEFPNFINVWRGEMSVIGPRPDAWNHATVFWNTVPHYKERFNVQPGITGLAQVRGGYAECSNATRRKARFDFMYVCRASWKMEIFIVWKTVVVLLTGFGAR